MSDDEIWLLHLSDLHFGSDIKFLLCQALVDAVNEAHDKLGCPRQALVIVVSGDLTQKGTDEQFALAYTFLSHQLRFGWDLSVLDELGFGMPADRVCTVAGNH